jgi:hypothetical protein
LGCGAEAHRPVRQGALRNHEEVDSCRAGASARPHFGGAGRGQKELFEADKNAQAKLAIVQKEAAFIRRMYGEQSRRKRAPPQWPCCKRSAKPRSRKSS